MMNSRLSRSIGAMMGLFLAAGTAAADSFTVDGVSPTIPSLDGIYNDGVLPTLGLSTVVALGLDTSDIIDAISDGADPIDPASYGDHDHLFSVTRASTGAAGSGVSFEVAADTPPTSTDPLGHATVTSRCDKAPCACSPLFCTPASWRW